MRIDIEVWVVKFSGLENPRNNRVTCEVPWRSVGWSVNGMYPWYQTEPRGQWHITEFSLPTVDSSLNSFKNGQAACVKMELCGVWKWKAWNVESWGQACPTGHLATRLPWPLALWVLSGCSPNLFLLCRAEVSGVCLLLLQGALAMENWAFLGDFQYPRQQYLQNAASASLGSCLPEWGLQLL